MVTIKNLVEHILVLIDYVKLFDDVNREILNK